MQTKIKGAALEIILHTRGVASDTADKLPVQCPGCTWGPARPAGPPPLGPLWLSARALPVAGYAILY